MSDMVERAAQALQQAITDACSHSGGSCAGAPDGRLAVNAAFDPKAVIRAVLAALREPTEAMIRATVTQTDHSVDQLDFAAAVIEGMPPLPPHHQRDGIIAAADVCRDWQAMIDAALASEEG